MSLIKVITSLLLCVIAIFLSSCTATLSKEECAVADWEIIGFEDGANGKNNTVIAKHRKACNKHGINPDIARYDQGYQNGNAQYCSHARGYQHGRNGSSGKLACQNSSSYQTGHIEGLAAYCAFDLGYQHSSNGKSTIEICTGHPVYLQGYDDGLYTFCTFDNGYDFGIDNKAAPGLCPSPLNDHFLHGYEQGQQVHHLLRDLEQAEEQLQSLLSRKEKTQKKALDTKNKITYNEALNSDERAQLLEQLEKLNKREQELNNTTNHLNSDIAAMRYQLQQLDIVLP